MNIIQKHIHGIIDYLVALTLLILPFFSIFPAGNGAGVACALLGALSVLQNLCTNYSMGAWHIIPVKIHLLLDALTSAMLIFTALFLTTTSSGSLLLICLSIIIVIQIALTKISPNNKEGMFIHPPKSRVQIIHFRRMVD